jgi:DNA polymerase
MGVKLSEAQAKNAVDNYRNSYAKVKELWLGCENAAIAAISNPNTAHRAGNKIILKCAKNALWMRLPSGRLICWQRPKLELLVTPWGAEKMGVTVHSQSTYTRQWCRNQLIGSSIFQSAVQGAARDCLAEGLRSLENAGYDVINLIHDEYLMLVDKDSAEQTLGDVLEIITQPPKWAPDLPLAAEGWVSGRYRK